MRDSVMSDRNAIEIHRLSKAFGGTLAVDDVSFAVLPGEVFGFMGHNGAGKTTTIRMLLGLLHPTRGEACVLGHDIVRDSLAIRRLSGYLPGDYALPKEMSARQFLRYIGAMFGFAGVLLERRIEELLELFGLAAVADKRLGAFSSGMIQKVGLAQALINEPRVLLLDEPTAGLDPIGRQELLELIVRLARNDGVTVLFSTHILSDIERVCERVAILHHGRLIASGDLADLKDRHGAAHMDDLYLSLVKTAV
jgi:ABC-2 type transport system ATP-binding protein